MKYYSGQDLKERNDLVKKNLGLAYYFARKYSNRGVSFPELLSSAFVGLVAASEHYNPEKGTFGMASFYYIRSSIFNEFRDGRLIKLPKNKSDVLMLIKKTNEKLEQKLRREPTIEEVQVETGIDASIIEIILVNKNRDIVSLDFSANDEEPLSEQIDNDIFPVDEKALSNEFWNRVKLLLSEEENQIIRSHFLNGNTTQEISTEFGCTCDSIRRIIKRSCEKLKKLKHCLN